MKILKLKNGDLDVFVKTLNVSLSFERSKARNDFVKTLFPISEMLEKKRLEIVSASAVKDAEGKPVMLPTGSFDLDVEGLKVAQEQYSKLMAEESSVEVNEHVEKNLLLIKK